MKTCFKCGEEKDLSEFYKHKQMADGLLGKCKTCTKQDATKYRNDHLEEVRAYDRGRDNRKPLGYGKLYKEINPDKCRATTMVGNAIRDKKLFRMPCEICGSEEYIHAHHDDYSKPLNVR